MNLEDAYNKYVPDLFLEDGHSTLYFGRSIITDSIIVAKNPDIVVIDRLSVFSWRESRKSSQIEYLNLSYKILRFISFQDYGIVDSVIIVSIVVSSHRLIAKILYHTLKSRLAKSCPPWHGPYVAEVLAVGALTTGFTGPVFSTVILINSWWTKENNNNNILNIRHITPSSLKLSRARTMGTR